MNFGPITTRCAVCGKLIVTMWQEFWPNRRGETFYCGYDCLQVDLARDTKVMNEVKQRRKEKKMNKLTLEMKKKAVEIAISGQNPLEYLKSCGCKAPDKMWYAIKQQLKTSKPDLYAKIPDFRGKTRKPETPEQMPTVKLSGPIRIETPEPEKVKVETPEGELKKPLEKIVGPCHIDKFLITAINHPDLGEFYYDKKFKSFDWRTPEGDEVSMSPAAWNCLLNELPHILRILGAR